MSLPAADGLDRPGPGQDLPPPAPPPVPEELDLWWGSYSNRAMLPSLLAALIATGFSGWLVWLLVEHTLTKLVFLGVAGVIWLIQITRWAYRYFTFVYRMTNRRLFCHRGLLYFPRDQVELAHVAQVLMRRNRWDRLVGTGQVLVYPDEPGRPPLVLKGLRHPKQVAEMIRLQVQKAREEMAPKAV